MTTTETSLRVRFAKAMGYVYVPPVSIGMVSIGINPTAHRLVWEKGMPDPTDSNTVREAMMGMSENEREKLVELVRNKLQLCGACPSTVLYYAFFKIEPTTIAELICEVRGF